MIDVYRIAAKSAEKYFLKKYNRSWSYLAMIALVWGFTEGESIMLRNYVVEAYLIPPVKNMAPTLRPGDRFLVNKISFSEDRLQRGMAIAFYVPTDQVQDMYLNIRENTIYIKRVIALPGDTVEMKGKDVIINGRLLPHKPVSVNQKNSWFRSGDEIYFESSDQYQYPVIYNDELIKMNSPGEQHRNFKKTTIPAGKIFVLGDNRDASLDSRYFGLLPTERILGIAQYRYLPVDSWSRLGVIENYLGSD